MTENKSYCDICGEQIDLTREFDIPILGTIPRLLPSDKPGYGYGDPQAKIAKTAEKEVK